ncbi:hypothetical protein ACFYWY_34245 [Streptomyces sp. NPDC002870]|uniref:hypothetical protein n=1 Tax=Streptomyces sp. NPDC002870 TaxID=3364666 RepID=UPI00369A22E1
MGSRGAGLGVETRRGRVGGHLLVQLPQIAVAGGVDLVEEAAEGMGAYLGEVPALGGQAVR